jgi:hypothetical protein
MLLGLLGLQPTRCEDLHDERIDVGGVALHRRYGDLEAVEDFIAIGKVTQHTCASLSLSGNRLGSILAQR